MSVTKGKINVSEYAKKVSGAEFLLLDNIPSTFVPTKEIFDKLIRGKDSQNHTQFAEALGYLTQDNLIETDWTKLEKTDGWKPVYRLARITPEGSQVLNEVLQNPSLKVRAISLALSIRSEQVVTEGAGGALTQLYQKIKAADGLFSAAQRDKIQ